MKIIKKQNPTFEKEVVNGLKKKPKMLSSKFLYDTNGDCLFQEIMTLPNYYLYRSEYEIIESHIQDLTQIFYEGEESLEIIDLGSGDGRKTKVLLDYLSKNAYNFTYRPIDISYSVLENLKNNLEQEFPGIKIQIEAGDYFEILKRLNIHTQNKKIILFLGSTIGNLPEKTAVRFLSQINSILNKNDILFLGFDRKKNPRLIWDAYNDKTGITASFVKNILYRINRELNADFDPNKFMHWTSYNPVDAVLKNQLIALEKMSVTINQTRIDFDVWEAIDIVISKKYSEEEVKELAEKSGLSVKMAFHDNLNYYTNYIFQTK